MLWEASAFARMRIACSIVAAGSFMAACSAGPIAPAVSPPDSVPVTPPATPVIVTDDFDRTALGPSWSIQANTGATVSLMSGDFGVGSANLLIASYIGSVLPPDQFSEAELSPAFDGTALKGVQVFVRRQDGPGVTPWRYGFYFNATTGFYTIKYDGGPTAQTDFMREVVGAPPLAGDVIRIEVRGTLIRGLLNGVEVTRVNDGRLTAGLAGLAFNPSRIAPRIVTRWKGGGL